MKRRGLSAVIAGSLLAILAVAPAEAAWNAGGGGSGYSKARNLPTAGAPSAVASNRNVTVTWTAPGGGAPPSGYVVRRYDNANQPKSVGAACAGTITATSCTEAGVPPGDWKYSVTAVRNNWNGAESAKSATVTVTAPALSLSPTTVNSFPKTLTGQVTSFAAGQTVTFRLDNPTTGPILSGSITPSTIPAGGTANASVTIPAGTTNGSHTVYALGSGGDQATAPITVNAPKVTASVIAKSAGGDPAFIQQGGTYYVYANVSGSGGPPTGLTSLTADVSVITAGQTAAPLSFGSYSVGGQTYNYRSAQLTARNPLAAGAKAFTLNLTDAGGTATTSNFSVTVDNTAPAADDVQTTNVPGGTVGKAELGDTLTLTYTEPMDADSILAGWDGSATNVVVHLDNTTRDTIEIWDPADSALLPLGTVDMRRNGYTTADMTFGLAGTPSTMVRNGSDVTITLGTPSIPTPTETRGSRMRWTPSAAATDWAGNACSTSRVTQSGPNGVEF